MRTRPPSGLAPLLATLALGFAALDLAAQTSPASQISTSQPSTAQTAAACQFPAPPPLGSSVDAFNQRLTTFVNNFCYLGWDHDVARRDAHLVHGGWVSNFYSPQAAAWMRAGRKGVAPDAAFIVKEMWANATCTDRSDSHCFFGQATMYKASQWSFDGWFWGTGAPTQDPTITYPWAAFGLYCLNCHAVASSESTFANPADMAPPVSPSTNRTRAAAPAAVAESAGTGAGGQGTATAAAAAETASPSVSPHFLRSHGTPGPSLATRRLLRRANPGAADFADAFSVQPLAADQIIRLPGEALDHVTSGPTGPQQFITSDQCIGCHNATEENTVMTPYMIYPPAGSGSAAGTVLNFSPYAEQHASLMGLSGRDPVFFAQLESEGVVHAPQKAEIQNTCFSCHGVQGQRQLQIDKQQPFALDMVYATGQDPYAEYGSLARDGISCTLCHHILVKDDVPFEQTFTGKFFVGPPEEVYGPYSDDLKTKPMEQALKLTPNYGAQIKSSKLCGSCHTVVLPVYDGNKVVKQNFEQATYVEWLNSFYQNEYPPIAPAAQTCQDCHMAKAYQGQDLSYRIASIEDETFPPMEYQLPKEDITLQQRKPFSRHTLVGLNVFVQQMFHQFTDSGSNNTTLGLRTKDPMLLAGPYGKPMDPLMLASQSAVEQAQGSTVELTVGNVRRTAGALEAQVQVENLAGHHFPSGVGFRRAFLEFAVLDAQGNPLWVSGGTSSAGVILGSNGRPLPSEFFLPVGGKQAYQPHYQVIESQDQVQIYEELMQNCQGQFTTSFLSLCIHVKDNRLQPLGWRKDGPYAQETSPHGNAVDDCDYTVSPKCTSYGQPSSARDSLYYRVPLAQLKGTPAKVVVTMYYQSTPPYYLADRYSIFNGCKDPRSPACFPQTQRLLYLAANLDTSVTIANQQPIADWKLELVSASAEVK